MVNSVREAFFQMANGALVYLDTIQRGLQNGVTEVCVSVVSADGGEEVIINLDSPYETVVA